MRQHIPGLGTSHSAAPGEGGSAAAGVLPPHEAEAAAGGQPEQPLGRRLRAFLGGKKAEGGAPAATVPGERGL